MLRKQQTSAFLSFLRIKVHKLTKREYKYLGYNRKDVTLYIIVKIGSYGRGEIHSFRLGREADASRQSQFWSIGRTVDRSSRGKNHHYRDS